MRLLTGGHVVLSTPPSVCKYRVCAITTSFDLFLYPLSLHNSIKTKTYFYPE